MPLRNMLFSSWPAASVLVLASLTQAESTCGGLINEIDSSSQLGITSSVEVDAQTLNFTSSGAKGSNLESLCRVKGSIPYGLNHSLGVELWLPENWNQRFIVVGNGGLAGYIDYAAMLSQVNSGYAVAAGDGGHLLANNGNGTTASGQYIPYLNNVEETAMWIHDSIATLTPPLQDLTGVYYNSTPKYSYYAGCSTGGAQGYALAQFHPQLFDGIIAGCPGNYYSHLILGFLWNYNHAHAKPNNASFLQQDTLNFITNATLDACDTLDSVEDRLLENPLECKFNVSTLACKDGQEPKNSQGQVQCLTADELVTVQAIYAGPKDANGTQIYPGFDPGSESTWMYQETFLATDYTYPVLQNLAFKNLSYDPSAFDFDTDVALVNATASPYINAISPDLTAYKARGGKMIVYQGWADAFNAGTWPITHLNMVDSFIKMYGVGSADEFMRLFMVPGWGHCAGAAQYPYVPSNLHTLEAMVDWVENGEAPAAIKSDQPADGSNTTRKLCPWPQTAKLKEGGQAGQFNDYECQ